MDSSTRTPVKNGFTAIPDSRNRRTRSTWAQVTAIALGLAAALALIAGETLAENECGPAEPGAEIVCAPSNYDTAEEGNVSYSPEESGGNFRIRLIDGLVIDYDRDDPDDDVGFSPAKPETPLHAAVSIITGDSAYAGDITVSSSADVTSNAKGILVGHAGESGAVRVDLNGGSITTRGNRAAGVELFHEGAGEIGIVARNVAINADGSVADGIGATHTGEGKINIDVRDVTITTQGRNADGVYGFHKDAESETEIESQAGNDIHINIQDADITTRGDEAEGILLIQDKTGEIEILVRDAIIQTGGGRRGGRPRASSG